MPTGVGPRSVTRRARSSSLGRLAFWALLGSLGVIGAVRLLRRQLQRALEDRRSAAVTSAASVTGAAPCFTGCCSLAARIERGARTANTSRPCSSAMRAVMSEPSAAPPRSPPRRPQVRRSDGCGGESLGRAAVVERHFREHAPFSAIASASAVCSGG